MNWKNWLISLGITAAPLTATTAEAAPSTKKDTLKTEQTKDTLKTEESKPTKKLSSADFAKQDSLSSASDTLHTDTLSSWERLRAAEKKMLLFIAHFESIKAKSYWDPKGKVWTVGLGFTQDANGRPVTRYTCIKDQEELERFWAQHVEAPNGLFETMDNTLPIDKMTDDEIAAIGSFAYNCGNGILGKKVANMESDSIYYKQTAFSKNYTDFKETGDSTILTKCLILLNKYVYCQKKLVPQLKGRREMESRVLKGEIKLDAEGTTQSPNVLNLSTAALGGIYSLIHGGKLPKDSTQLVNKLNKIPGQNYQDTLRREFSPSLPIIHRKKNSSR